MSKDNLVLNVSNLSKSFGDTEVLKGVSFSVEKGEAIALLGHNGSGKSTLFNCMAYLLEPTSGFIRVSELDFSKLSKKALRNARSKIGFIFQKHNLVNRLGVLSNIIHGKLSTDPSPRLWFQKFAPSALRLKALNLLEKVGLAHIAGKLAGQLSGGQSQRVAIARALMQEPELILADEPTASLDPQAGTEVMELLYKLAQDEGITLVFVTHNVEHALKYSNRILALKAGELVIDKSTKEITKEEIDTLYE